MGALTTHGDPDPVARQRAAESLTRLGGDAVIPYLTRGLADPMERVRRAAVHAFLAASRRIPECADGVDPRGGFEPPLTGSESVPGVEKALKRQGVASTG